LEGHDRQIPILPSNHQPIHFYQAVWQGVLTHHELDWSFVEKEDLCQHRIHSSNNFQNLLLIETWRVGPASAQRTVGAIRRDEQE